MFSYQPQLSIKIILLTNVVVILTFVSNNIRQEILIFQYFSFYQQLKCHTYMKLSWTRKRFYKLGARAVCRKQMSGGHFSRRSTHIFKCIYSKETRLNA